MTNFRSLLQKSPIKEMILCKRDLCFKEPTNRFHPITGILVDSCYNVYLMSQFLKIVYDKFSGELVFEIWGSFC